MKATWNVDIDRLTGRLPAARQALAEAVLAGCAPYVPYRTGALLASGRVVDGGVEYAAAHARAVYYGDRVAFGRTVHPLATARWFEVAKAAHEADWVRAAVEVISE